MNINTILQRGAMLVLMVLVAMGRIASACSPANTVLGSAMEITIPPHTLSTTVVPRDDWYLLGRYEITGVKVMGDDCSTGYTPKRFFYYGTGVAPTTTSKFVGFAGSVPLFQVSKNANNIVGIAIEVRKTGDAGWQPPVPASTQLKSLTYNPTPDRPAIDVRVSLYIKIPLNAQPGDLVPAGIYPENIFAGSYDEIAIQGDRQNDIPVKVNLGAIRLLRPTCAFSGNELNKTIDMGQMNPAAFTGDGTKSAEIPFTLSVQGCNEVVSDLHMAFAPQSGVPNNPNLFPTDRPELGLGLISIDSRGAPLGGQAIKPNDSLDFDPQASQTSYNFRAFLEQIGNGPVDSGGVDARVRVTVTYD